MVGTSQGTVWDQQQGRGTSTVISDPIGDMAAKNRLSQADFAAKQRMKDDSDARKLVEKELTKTPEWWYKHNEELQGDLKGLRDEYATLRKKGITNPMSESPEFMAKFSEYQNKAANSKELKKDWQATMQKLLTAKEGEYDATEVQKVNSFYDKKLGELYASGETRPLLMRKEPEVTAINFWGTRMKLWKQATGLTEATPEDLTAFRDQVMDDTAEQEDIAEIYSQRLANVDPAALEVAKAAYGGDMNAMFKDMAMKDIASLGPRKPFDISDLVADGLKMTGDYERQSEYGTVTTYEKNTGSQAAKLKKAAYASAQMQLSTSNSALNKMQQMFEVTGTRDEVIKKLTPILGDMIINGANQKTGRAVDEPKSASASDKAAAGTKQWWAEYYDGKPGADRAVVGGKDNDGYTVTSASMFISTPESARIYKGMNNAKPGEKGYINPEDREYMSPAGTKAKYAVVNLEKVGAAGEVSRQTKYVPLDTQEGRGYMESLYLNTAKLKGLYEQGPESTPSGGGFNDF